MGVRINNIKTQLQELNPRSPKIIIVAFLFLLVPPLLIFLSLYFQNMQNQDIPDGDPARGMIYKDLGPRQKTGPCKGIFAVTTEEGRIICTHGPDPAPSGVDVRKRQEPGFASKLQSSVQNKSKVAGVTCAADGQSGRRVQVLYVRASDVEDRFGAFLPDLRATVTDLNQSVIDSAAKTGGSRYVRFVHDGNCEPIIEHVVLSPAGDDSYENTAKELAAKGYNKHNRKYFIWRDANQLCGIADAPQDDSPGLNNISNIVTGNAVVDNGCWSRPDTALHELGHALGAVQKSAPGHDGAHMYHAANPQDVLYWTDGQRACLWDCDNDDYFSTNPTGGSYLASHWNIAYNEFLGGDEDKRPKFVPGAAGDVYAVNRQGGSGKTDIHALSAASNFTDFSIHAASGLHATPGTTWSFAIGNYYDEDNLVDIYAINRNGGSGKTEVHVLSGKSNFSDFALQTETALHTTEGNNWVFDVGDGPDEDPNADLFAINKQGGGGKTEVHILQGGPGMDYKNFSHHIETGLHATDKNWDFVMGIFNDNFYAGFDIYAVNRRGGSGKTEVHILSGESGYKDFILQTVTPLDSTDNANWSFTTGFFDNDLKADLYAINRNGGSGKTEVHILSGESGFKEFISHSATGLEATNNSNWTFPPSQDYEGNSAPVPTATKAPVIDPTDPPVITSIPTEPVVSLNPTDPPIGGPNPTGTQNPTSGPVPTWFCGGSPNSVCASPTLTQAPTGPNPTIGNPTVTPIPEVDECLDPRSAPEKIRDWVSGFLRKINNYIQLVLGNPQNPPPPPVPCIRQ